MSESDEDADKTIRLALADNDNDNAFQQGIGLGLDAVFSTRTSGFRARVLARLFRIFAEFERAKLFKLDRSSLTWSTNVQGEQSLEFRYINLESDETETFSKTFTARGGL